MRKAVPMVLLLILLPASGLMGQRPSDDDGKPPSEEAQRQDQSRPPLTNVSVVELVKAGMSEDAILNIISTQPGQYILDSQYVDVLKRVGVSEKIIATMRINSGRGLTPTPPAPETLGLYFMSAGELRAIVGRAVVFHRTGSVLASVLTLRMVSGKVNIKIPGEHAGIFLSSTPEFYYRTGPNDPPGVVSLVLSLLKVSSGDRQLEGRASGFGRESWGISINAQIQTNISQASGGMYRVVPVDKLKAGQYAFYLRTTGASTQDAFLYDFSVE